MKCPTCGHEPEERTRWADEARDFIQWFNVEFRSKFTPNPTTTKLVKACMRLGFGQDDMRLVALYLKQLWSQDAKMQTFLKPQSVLVPSKFVERLDLARMQQEAKRARDGYHAWARGALNRPTHPSGNPGKADVVAPDEVRDVAAQLLAKMKGGY